MREKEKYAREERGAEGKRGWLFGGPLVAERVAAARGHGEEKKKESELLHPTCVFLYASLWRPFGVRYSNGLGEQQHREALESPTLVGDTCFNDYPVESRRDGFIMPMRFCRFVCASI